MGPRKPSAPAAALVFLWPAMRAARVDPFLPPGGGGHRELDAPSSLTAWCEDTIGTSAPGHGPWRHTHDHFHEEKCSSV